MVRGELVVLLVIGAGCGSGPQPVAEPVVCPSHSILNDGECMCELGYTPVSPPCTSVCAAGEYWSDGACTTCPTGPGPSAGECACGAGAHWASEAGCVCADGLVPRPDGSCSAPIPLTGCCECLDRTIDQTDPTPTDSCLPVSVETCEAQSVPIVTNCYCWEECYAYCADTMYPYAEPPNGCLH